MSKIMFHYIFVYKSDPFDLILWPSEMKINWDHVFTKTNQQMQYERSVINMS